MTQALHFDADELVSALGERLDRALRGEPSLVVGLFGEWGSGKTTLLRAIEDHFARRAEKVAEDTDSLTLPVFFNAWRYEAEDHLIIPLLKTAERAVVDWQDAQMGKGRRAWEWLRDRGLLLAESVIALSYGFKGKLALPGGSGVEFEPGKAIEEERKRWKERKAGEPSAVEELVSRYYDFHHYMEQLTGRDGTDDSKRLNLVFLIDDLDRCLPEKAVQMLESIKLFLEVEGCVFVVAVDDEVVARGIAHRYRDYAVRKQHAYDSVAHSLHPERFKRYQEIRGPVPQQPITGTEYLEKIVHLPARLPQPLEAAVRRFLVARYPEMFAAPETDDERSEPVEAEDDARLREQRKRVAGGRGAGRQKELLDLFVRCVPAVPRKLVRAAELFEMLHRLAYVRDWDPDEPTLARLVFLQLFAPALYRFGRRQPAFLATLEEWAESPLWMTGDHVEQSIEARLKEAAETEDPEERRSAVLPLEQRERPLLVLVRDA